MRRDLESCHINGYSQFPDICRCRILHVDRPLQHIPINTSWGLCHLNVLTIVGNLQNASRVSSWQFGSQCCWNSPSLDYVGSMSWNGHIVYWSIVYLGGPLVPVMLAHILTLFVWFTDSNFAPRFCSLHHAINLSLAWNNCNWFVRIHILPVLQILISNITSLGMELSGVNRRILVGLLLSWKLKNSVLTCWLCLVPLLLDMIWTWVAYLLPQRIPSSYIWLQSLRTLAHYCTVEGG